MGQGVVHVFWAYGIKLRVPDAVLFGKQEGEKLYKKGENEGGGWEVKDGTLNPQISAVFSDFPHLTLPRCIGLQLS